MYSSLTESVANVDFKLLAPPPKRRAVSSPPNSRKDEELRDEPLSKLHAIDNIDRILGDLMWNLPIAVQARAPRRLHPNHNYYTPTGDIIFDLKNHVNNEAGERLYQQPPNEQERCFCGHPLLNGEELFIFWPCAHRAHRYINLVFLSRSRTYKKVRGGGSILSSNTCIELKICSFHSGRNCWRRRKIEDRQKIFHRCLYGFCHHIILDDADHLFNMQILLMKELCGFRYYKNWYLATEMTEIEEEEIRTLMKNMIWMTKWKWNPNFETYHNRDSLVGHVDDVMNCEDWDLDVGPGLESCMDTIRQRKFENGTEFQFQIEHRSNRLPLNVREVSLKEFLEERNGYVTSNSRREVYIRLGEAMRQGGMANMTRLNGFCLEFVNDRALIYKVRANPEEPLQFEGVDFSGADEDDGDDGQAKAEEPPENGYATRDVGGGNASSSAEDTSDTQTSDPVTDAVQDEVDNEQVAELFKADIGKMLDDYANGKGDPQVVMHYLELLESNNRLRRAVLDKSNDPTVLVPKDSSVAQLHFENLRIVETESTERNSSFETAKDQSDDGLGISSILSLLADEPEVKGARGYVEWSHEVSRNYSLVRQYEFDSLEGNCSTSGANLTEVSTILNPTEAVRNFRKKEINFILVNVSKIIFRRRNLTFRSMKIRALPLDKGSNGLREVCQPQWAKTIFWRCQLCRCKKQTKKRWKVRMRDHQSILDFQEASKWTPLKMIMDLSKVIDGKKHGATTKQDGNLCSRVKFTSNRTLNSNPIRYALSPPKRFALLRISKKDVCCSRFSFSLSMKQNNSSFCNISIYKFDLMGITYSTFMYLLERVLCFFCPDDVYLYGNWSLFLKDLLMYKLKAYLANFVTTEVEFGEPCTYKRVRPLFLFLHLIKQLEINNISEYVSCKRYFTIKIKANVWWHFSNYVYRHTTFGKMEYVRRFFVREVEINVPAQRDLYSQIVDWNEHNRHFDRLNRLVDRGLVRFDPERTAVRGTFTDFKARAICSVRRIVLKKKYVHVLELTETQFKERALEFTAQLISQCETNMAMLEMLPVSLDRVLDILSYICVDYKLVYIISHHFNQHQLERIHFHNNRLGYVLKRTVRRIRSSIAHYLVYGFGNPGYYTRIVREETFRKYITIMECHYLPRHLLTDQYYSVARDYWRARNVAVEALESIGFQEPAND